MKPTRFGTIDGLRGYLAFFVFLHHATIWFIFSKTNLWIAPDSNFYNHLGQSSVALFFMITSFLFYDKLLNIELKSFSWASFFISRFFRLTPLYVMVVFAIIILVGKYSNWTQLEPRKVSMANAMDWLLFTIPGVPYINTIDPFFFVAGVTWSLPYEWCFYFILPLIALTTRTRSSIAALILSGIAVWVAQSHNLEPRYLSMFGGGLVAAKLVRYEKFLRFSQKPLASVILLATLGVVLIYPTAYHIIPFLCLTAAFCMIAGGTDLFGILLTKTSRRLGEVAYSIYLVHGLMLFTMINMVVGKENIARMSTVSYWLCIALLVPFLLGICGLTYHFIEKPGIDFGKKLAAKLSQARRSR
ncbi:MAG: acyltransferase [Pseudomonadota bacterium]|nr:acyltransferase [Pseudomonadota bacterium]